MSDAECRSVQTRRPLGGQGTHKPGSRVLCWDRASASVLAGAELRRERRVRVRVGPTEARGEEETGGAFGPRVLPPAQTSFTAIAHPTREEMRRSSWLVPGTPHQRVTDPRGKVVRGGLGAQGREPRRQAEPWIWTPEKLNPKCHTPPACFCIMPPFLLRLLVFAFQTSQSSSKAEDLLPSLNQTISSFQTGRELGGLTPSSPPVSCLSSGCRPRVLNVSEGARHAARLPRTRPMGPCPTALMPCSDGPTATPS